MMISFAGNQAAPAYFRGKPEQQPATDKELEAQIFDALLDELNLLELETPKQDCFISKKSVPPPPQKPKQEPKPNPLDKILEKRANHKPSPLRNSFTREDLLREQAEQAEAEKRAAKKALRKKNQ